MTILRADNITVQVTARSQRLTILDDVSLFLEQGETLGLVGESGSGKTTLARALLGLQKTTVGTIHFDGQQVSDFASLRLSTAMMFQDAVSSLSPRMRVSRLLLEPFIIHNIKIADQDHKITELLAMVGLPAHLAERYPHELSGGQARRVGVARALALHPKLLIADEPTAGLDVSVQADILNLMMAMKRQFGLSYLIVSHNLAMLRHVCDRVAVMYLGRIVESGTTHAIFAKPRHPYTRMLVAAEPHPDPRRRNAYTEQQGEVPSLFARPQGCEFHARCTYAQPVCHTAAPQTEKMDDARHIRCHFPLDPNG